MMPAPMNTNAAMVKKAEMMLVARVRAGAAGSTREVISNYLRTLCIQYTDGT